MQISYWHVEKKRVEYYWFLKETRISRLSAVHRLRSTSPRPASHTYFLHKWGLLQHMSDEINTRGEVADEADDEDDSIISLIDDEGRTSEYEILDAIETEEGRFVALMPLASIDEESGEAEYMILQVEIVDNEEELAEIEDDELLTALDDLFRERFKELYGDEDEEQSPEVDSLAGA